MSTVITDADGIDWPPMPDRGKPPPRSGTPFVPEDMRPAWTSRAKVTCQDVLVLGELLVKCELALEGRHDPGRIGWRKDAAEHHGHIEMPGKIWVTVTWREAGK